MSTPGVLPATHEHLEGIPAYAPEKAYVAEGFSPDTFEYLYTMEEHNFWFKTRNEALQHLFRKYTKVDAEQVYMEIGCGTGYVTRMVHALAPKWQMYGAELFIEGLLYARKRLKGIDLVQLDATELPVESKIDVVGMFDVLEHIPQDELVMRNVYSALKPGGKFMISVPQHQWLWSTTDDTAHHQRRYSKKEMIDKLKAAGFNIRYANSFIFFLLPAVYLDRLKGKNMDAEKAWKRYEKPNPIINGILTGITRFENFLSRIGLRYPLGSSLFVVAEKPNGAD